MAGYYPRKKSEKPDYPTDFPYWAVRYVIARKRQRQELRRLRIHLGRWCVARSQRLALSGALRANVKSRLGTCAELAAEKRKALRFYRLSLANAEAVSAGTPVPHYAP